MHARRAEPVDRSALPTGPDWWRGAVGYEIYIRSFLDTNADGLGDLDGITTRLDDIDALGIDVLWITPFYPSPGKDQGYDVSDYVDVDPAFGTLADFDRLIAEATARDLRVFVDVVPNHTSDQHPWFQAAITDVESPFRDNPQIRPVTPGMHPKDVFASFQHVHDLHRPETTLIFREWRKVVEPYDAVLLGEMDVRNIERFTEYLDSDGLDVGFVLKLSANLFEPATIISDLLTYDRAANGGAAWALSNHDQPRAVSRFGGGDLGVRRAMAVTTLMLGLDGITFIYQGEELGLPDAVLVGEARDPVSTRNHGVAGRDAERGPMPWDASHLNGFSIAAQAWLDTELLPEWMTVAGQVADPTSTWHRYRDMIGLRKRLPELWSEPLEIFDRQATSLVIFRGLLTVVANLDDKAFEVTPEGTFVIEFESCAGAAGGDGGVLRILPESTVVLSRRP
jgi:glycosidase